jgi:hypothetical protein
MSVRPLAAFVLILEAAGVAALLVWQASALFSGDTASVPSALALMVLTLIGVVAVAGFAVATARGRSWGRSGGIVVQLLIIAVAIGALTGVGAAPLVALAIAAPGVVGFVLLLLAAREAAPPRAERDDAE